MDTHNAPKFCEGNLCSWLNRIGCVSYKAPSDHKESNEILERVERTMTEGSESKEYEKEEATNESSNKTGEKI